MAQKSTRQPQITAPAPGSGKPTLLERAATATGFPLASLLDVAVYDDRLVIVTIDGRKHLLAALPDLTADQQTADDVAGDGQ